MTIYFRLEQLSTRGAEYSGGIIEVTTTEIVDESLQKCESV